MEWAPDLTKYPKFLHAKIRRGKGCGVGEAYRPWYTTREIGSQGTCDNPSSILNGRIYELLSDYEALYFYLLERQPHVLDIREQFPILQLEATFPLAAKFGIEHKQAGRRRKWPEPYTIDFLITERVNGIPQIRAASIKPPDIAFDDRTLSKLKIEHAWCEQNGIPWELVDMSGLDHLVALAVLRFVRKWYQNHFDPGSIPADIVARHFLHLYRRNVLLSELVDRLASRLRLRRTEAEDAFRFAAWRGLIKVSLRHEIALNRPLVLNAV